MSTTPPWTNPMAQACTGIATKWAKLNAAQKGQASAHLRSVIANCPGDFQIPDLASAAAEIDQLAKYVAPTIKPSTPVMTQFATLCKKYPNECNNFARGVATIGGKKICRQCARETTPSRQYTYRPSRRTTPGGSVVYSAERILTATSRIALLISAVAIAGYIAYSILKPR